MNSMVRAFARAPAPRWNDEGGGRGAAFCLSVAAMGTQGVLRADSVSQKAKMMTRFLTYEIAARGG